MVRPIHTNSNILAGMLTLNIISKIYLGQFRGSGTSPISEFGLLGSWANGMSDSHQIWYLGLYTNSKCNYRKLSRSAQRFWYLPYSVN